MSALSDYGWQIFAVSDAEVRKLRHDSIELVTRAVQPALWLLFVRSGDGTGPRNHRPWNELSRLLGTGHSRPKRVVRGDLLRHQHHLGARFGSAAPLFGESGTDSALVLGKALSSTVRGFSQALVV